jgi:hypothetical protein
MLTSDASRRQEQLEHRAQVQALAQAVASAISAIEKNDLKQFEIHLAAQERICNRLSSPKWMPPSTAKQKAVDGKNPDAQLLQEIRQAYVALAQLNRVYAALLKRARKSISQIAAVYRSGGLGYGCERSPLPQQKTWSCEV